MEVIKLFKVLLLLLTVYFHLLMSKLLGITWQVSNIFSALTAGSYNLKIRNSLTSCEYTYTPNPIVLSAPTCVEICNDSIDNDGNGSTDCDDIACKMAPTLIKRD